MSEESLSGVVVDAEALMDLVRQWRDDANVLRTRYGCPERAAYFEQSADELEEWVWQDFYRELTPDEAADLTEYHKDHLARLAREGVIRNVGQPGAPRYLKGTLPRKAKAKPVPVPESPSAAREEAAPGVVPIPDREARERRRRARLAARR